MTSPLGDGFAGRGQTRGRQEKVSSSELRCRKQGLTRRWSVSRARRGLVWSGDGAVVGVEVQELTPR